jgi:hypothetical protein
MKVRDSDVLACVREQRKVSHVLGMFGPLDFTMLRPVLTWRAFWSLWTVYFFNFPIFLSGCGNPQITNQWTRVYNCTFRCNQYQMHTAEHYSLQTALYSTYPDFCQSYWQQTITHVWYKLYVLDNEQNSWKVFTINYDTSLISYGASA